jgi:ABC-type sugar transport system ATPase subunit
LVAGILNAAGTSMIALLQVTKNYGSVISLDGVSLAVSPGETVVIRGPSGSGKTTLLRLIAGLEIPTQGQIFIAGEQVSSPSGVKPPYKRSIGFVFQRSALWPHMTVMQNIYFVMDRMPKLQAEEHLNQLLEQTALQELANRYPNQLSGGEARRVALARALAANPKILLMDEPLTNLDPDIKEHLLGLIRGYIAKTNTTLLYVTHIADEEGQVGGRVIHLQAGRVVAA